MDDARFARAIAAIDAANAGDPNRIRVRGIERPKERAHAELVSEWVRRLRADPPQTLLLAARAHHIRRWTIPRSSYPDGRTGYLRWRRALHDVHCAEARRILAGEGYDSATISRVEEIIRKQDLKNDTDAQALEDALCLVFLETQFHDLAARLEEGKIVDVVRKTLRKMSADGKRLALEIEMPPEDRALLERALGQEKTA